jgi:small subunit ribosomal protein S20
LANIKSQIKRNRQNQKHRLRNRAYRGAARSAVLEARESIRSGEPNSREAVLRAISLLDKAAERGVLHPNNAARRKGRLTRRLATMSKPAPGSASTATTQDLESPSEQARKKPTSRKTAAKKPGTKAASK